MFDVAENATRKSKTLKYKKKVKPIKLLLQ